MFKSISWQEYFYTCAIIIGFYYAISILLLYSKEIIQKFSKLDNNSSKPEMGSPVVFSNLMGTIRKDQPIQRVNPHQNIVPAEEISIASEAPSNFEESASSDRLLIGTVSDLLHEIEALSKIISDNAGTKEDSIPMFHTLLSNYPQLSGTHYQDAIDRVIFDQCRSVCAFEIELVEIKSWWPSIESSK